MQNSITLLIAEINKSGGTERVVTNLANDLVTRGVHVGIVSVFTHNAKSFYPLKEHISLQQLSVPYPDRLLYRSTIGFLKALRAVKQIYKQSEHTVFMATDPFLSIILAIMGNLFRNKSNRIIVAEHMALSIAHKYSLYARKLFFRHVDAMVVLTHKDKLFLEKLLPNIPCVVIPNRVSFLPETVSSCRNKQLLAIGRIEYQKNFEELVGIVSLPLKSHSDWHLTIIGDGTLKEKLQQKIDKAGLSEQIKIIAPTNKIQDYFLQASIYLMSSRFEGFPMVLVEAKACGLPIISYDCPNGPSDIIGEEDGILVPTNDKSRFQDALNHLMDHPEMRAEMGINARKDALERFSGEKIMQQWLQLFESL